MQDSTTLLVSKKKGLSMKNLVLAALVAPLALSFVVMPTAALADGSGNIGPGEYNPGAQRGGYFMDQARQSMDSIYRGGYNQSPSYSNGGYGYSNDGYGYPNETSLGKTKREKRAESRYQYCGKGIGWVRFGTSCAGQIAPVQPTPYYRDAQPIMIDGMRFSCRQDGSRRVCVSQ